MMLLPTTAGEEESQHPSAPSDLQSATTLAVNLWFYWFMGGTTGLEPATSAVTANQKHVSYWKQGNGWLLSAPWGTVGNSYYTVIEPASSAL